MRWYALLMVLAILIGISASVLIAMMLPDVPQAPAVEWLETDYVPVSGCPGDKFGYKIKLDVNRPSVLFLVVSHLRGANGEGDTVLLASADSVAVTSIPTARIIEDEDPVFALPNLPPGEYTRVLAVGTLSEDSLPTMRLMPYTIRDDCGD